MTVRKRGLLRLNFKEGKMRPEEKEVCYGWISEKAECDRKEERVATVEFQRKKNITVKVE